MAISEVSICNSALIKLGAERISSLSEDSKLARLCLERYAQIRDVVLYEHPWNFATERVVLSRRVDAPAFGYTYHYDLPADCLRVLETDFEAHGYKYIIEGRKLLTDQSEVSIKYIKRVTGAHLFTPSFAEAVSLRLASDISYPAVQSTTRESALLAQYDNHLRTTRSYDAQEGTPDEFTADEYINAHIFGELI